MASLQPPPTYNLLIDEEGKATIPWILFFNQLFSGDRGSAWIPSFQNLTTVGAAPTITGTFYKIGQSLCYFKIKIVPGTSTSAVAGTTYISNFPLTMNGDGICFAVSGLLGSISGMCDQSSNNIFVPTWTTVTVPLTIVGMVEIA